MLQKRRKKDAAQISEKHIYAMRICLLRINLSRILF